MSSATTASATHIVKQLEPLRGKRVSVVLTNGRHLLANLASYDNLSNVMLSNVSEHLYSVEISANIADNNENKAGAEQQKHITRTFEVDANPHPMMIRGTMIAAIGLVDTLAEAAGEV